MTQTVPCIVKARGRSIDYTPVSAVGGGMVVIQSGLIGVTPQAIEAGRKGTIIVDADVEGPKDSSDMSTPGLAIYWDNSAGCFTTTATDYYFGQNLEAAATSATKATVRMLASESPISVIESFTGSQIFNPLNYGAVGDNSTDDYTALMRTLDAAKGASDHGGTVLIPAGKIFKIGGDAPVTIPNGGVEVVVDNPTGVGYRQPPIRICGEAIDFYSNLHTHDVKGGSVLNLVRAADTPADNRAKIETFGLGNLEIDHLTLMDDTDGTTNFLFSTLTSCNIHDVFFRGKTSRWHDATYPTQDAIVFGGENAASESGRTSGFQGYGTKVVGCYFDNIRRCVYQKTWCNSINVERNTVWNGCGGVAPFEVLGKGSGAVPLVAGGVFANNLIEGYFYNFGFKLTNAEQFTFIGNSMWDIFTSEGDFEYVYRFESTASYNTIFGGFNDTSDPTLLVSDAGTGNKRFTYNGMEGSSLVFGPVTINQTGTKGITLQQGTGTVGGPAFYLYRGAVLCGEVYMYGTADSGTYHLYLQSDTGKVVLAPKAASTVNITTLPVYANNAAALAGSRVAGDLYRTNGDPDTICIVH